MQQFSFRKSKIKVINFKASSHKPGCYQMGCLWRGKYSRQRKIMQHSFKEFHPSNQAETLRKNFPARLPGSQLEKPRSQEPGQPALSYEHIENFTKDSEVRNLGNQASSVNWTHMKRRPLVWNRVKSFITVREGRGWEGYRRGERKVQEVGDLKGWEMGEKGEVIQQHFYL